MWRKEWRDSQHRGPATALVLLPWGGKCVSAGKDGTLRVWAPDLRPLQTLPYARAGAGAGAAWASDAVRLLSDGQEKLAVASADRSLSIMNVLPAERDPHRPDEHNCLGFGGRLVLPAATGPALCLAAVPAPGRAGGGGDQDQTLAFGTAAGAVAALRCPLPAPAAERALRGRGDLEVLHREHGGWVTALLRVPEVGLLSSSLDATVKVFDPARGAVTATAGVHAKAVRCMAYAGPLSLVIR
jgi:WD40 repeat protein